MNSAVSIFERLLQDQAAQKEHILETFSPHLSDLENRMTDKFDNLVSECIVIYGNADFSSTPRPSDKVKTSLPHWSLGSPRNGGTLQTLKLAYWKRPESINYLALRSEIHPTKDKPMHFDLVLGARRRREDALDSGKIDKLRNAKNHWFRDFLGWLAGRSSDG
jgi:hypothetical protein